MELLGIDIGGSGIKASIVDAKTGELLSERKRISTPQPAKPKDVAEVVREIIKSLNWTGPAGVSFPTVIKNGKALQYGNLHKSWKGTQIDELLKKHCG